VLTFSSSSLSYALIPLASFPAFVNSPRKYTPPKLTLLIHSATGVEKYDVSLENQTAEIITKDDTLPYETVLTTIKKTGKKVKSGEADGKDMPIE
jgi:hypothetical protein